MIESRSQLVPAGESERGGTKKEHEEAFGGDQYVYYPYCGNSFTVVNVKSKQ